MMKNMNRRTFISLIVIFGVILIGWLVFKQSELKIKKISFKSGDIFFSPREIRVKKNQLLDIEIENDGHHTFVIEELGIKTVLNIGKSNLQIKPDKKGKFIFYCDVEDHRKLGQWGTLIVE